MARAELFKSGERSRYFSRGIKAYGEWNITGLANVLYVGVAIALILWLVPARVVALDEGQNGIESSDQNIDLDYNDPFLEYRRWREQSMLGKGEKIGEDIPETIDEDLPVTPRYVEDSYTNNVLGDTEPDNRIAGISDTQRHVILKTDTPNSHQPSIYTSGISNSHRISFNSTDTFNNTKNYIDIESESQNAKVNYIDSENILDSKQNNIDIPSHSDSIDTADTSNSRAKNINFSVISHSQRTSVHFPGDSSNHTTEDIGVSHTGNIRHSNITPGASSNRRNDSNVLYASSITNPDTDTSYTSNNHYNDIVAPETFGKHRDDPTSPETSGNHRDDLPFPETSDSHSYSIETAVAHNKHRHHATADNQQHKTAISETVVHHRHTSHNQDVPHTDPHRYHNNSLGHKQPSTQVSSFDKNKAMHMTIVETHPRFDKNGDNFTAGTSDTGEVSYINTGIGLFPKHHSLEGTTAPPGESSGEAVNSVMIASPEHPSNESANTSRMGVVQASSPEEKPVIYIAGLFPSSQEITTGSVGRGVLPAVHIAVDHVNTDSQVNRKYILKMASNDTRCDMAVATKAFFDMMADSHSTTAMLFGDACYNVTAPIVQIAHQWGMYQLSYADTNPTLSDRDNFPNFYRTVPSDSDFNPARLALLRHFNWTTVGTIHQAAQLDEDRHTYASNKFDGLMEAHKINISIRESFADNPDAAIRNLKAQDVRIIVGNFDQNVARKVFCSARQNSMFGPKHQWIILGTYDDDWWTVQDTTIKCSPAELNDTIHGYLATDVLPLSTSDDVTESGRTSAEYMKLYNEARGKEFSKYHGYAYDGVWVVAKALDRLLDDVSVNSDTFRGPMVGRVLNETSFHGVTGRVQFLNGDRVGSMTILQMQHGRLLKVGEYHALSDTLNLDIGEPIRWRDGKHPVDRGIRTDELRHVSTPVYVGFVVMAALGVTMAALFLAVNIRYRRHRYIKMSSPNMNNLIIVGCILCYTSIILLGTEPDQEDNVYFSYLCTARSWTLALGFTLAFGAMFGKTWRVHAIFTNIKLNKKVIKDYKLLLLVLVLVLVDVVILVTWQIVDPFDKAVKRLSPEVYEDYELIPKIAYCYSHHMEIWLGALYVFKGLLLAFGCFLAWETRHVTIPALNDSKYIGMSVYNVVIMCVSGAAVSFIIQDSPTQSFIIIGLFIIFCTTITLCLVFLPKVIQLKLNPKGDEQRLRAALKKNSKKASKPDCSVQKEKLKTTLDENRRLRGFLEQKAHELEGLLEQLGDDVTENDLCLSSGLLHNRVTELKSVDDSPGKLSAQSRRPSEVGSTYSEGSGTTTLYTNEESSPTAALLKSRFHSGRHHSEVIEMSRIRYSSRKISLTIPPQSEDECDVDPFGGVYLGPSDSSIDQVPPERDRDSRRESIGERQPLISNSAPPHAALYRPGNASSADSLLDNLSRAQGLMTSFGSVDTNTENLAYSQQEKNHNGLLPSLHVAPAAPADVSYREVFASDDIVLL